MEASERAERALYAYTDEEERDEGFGSIEEWKAVVGAAGQAHAAVALYPAWTGDEVLVKLRAIQANTTADSEAEDLRDDIRRNGGHGYTVDLLRGLAIDLLRLTEGTPCA
ncbi:hypothetical protein [Methylobacterium sp. NEAU K]|uniref:hypothetical protein n=1 Tax=Methylobacterium sp. NEAU K TaxID=3064946 RepID=UPI002736B44F|nr:hypothetical protein [Methylobacterium sp. NEAU K]MDP4005340.1 hypothetical protein [Methylobacterium sp. NEAU K]